MPLPDTVRVKLSSEAAEYISITPVVVREIPLRELVEQMLGITGKDDARVRELLLRGTLVNGASRFRWTGWDADRGGIVSLLATFPDPMPERRFEARHCIRAVLQGGRLPIEIPREAGTRKPFLRRGTYWEGFMRIAAAHEPQYLDYSYRDKADVYRLPLSAAEAAELRAASGLLTYSKLEEQIRASAFDAADLYTIRPQLADAPGNDRPPRPARWSRTP